MLEKIKQMNYKRIVVKSKTFLTFFLHRDKKFVKEFQSRIFK